MMMPITMSDTTGDTTRHDVARQRRVPVHEAADVLGITPDAVRARLRRGSLVGEKTGTLWYVVLPVDAPGEHATSRDTRQSHDTTSRDATPGHDVLIAELRQDKAYLQDALDRALAQLADERERADVLMREALGRIETLTAGEPRQEAAQRTQEGPHDEQRVDVDQGPVAPWWRRWWRSLMEGA